MDGGHHLQLQCRGALHAAAPGAPRKGLPQHSFHQRPRRKTTRSTAPSPAMASARSSGASLHGRACVAPAYRRARRCVDHATRLAPAPSKASAAHAWRSGWRYSSRRSATPSRPVTCRVERARPPPHAPASNRRVRAQPVRGLQPARLTTAASTGRANSSRRLAAGCTELVGDAVAENVRFDGPNSPAAARLYEKPGASALLCSPNVTMRAAFAALACR